MVKIKLGTKKIIYIFGALLSLVLVYVTGKDHQHYTSFSTDVFVPKEANADVPYSQTSYYSQSTYGSGDVSSGCGDAGCSGCGCGCGGDGGGDGDGGDSACDCGCAGSGDAGNCEAADCAGDEYS